MALGPIGHAQLGNGDFSSGVADWDVEGTVTVPDGAAVLAEGSGSPILYQAVAVSGYVYELRFDVYLGGLSSEMGTGSLDTAQVLVFVDTDATGMTPESAAGESLLIEADADGLLTIAPNAQVVANAALGDGWYSAVVEVTSDFEAIAPAALIVDHNALADSSIAIDNVSLVALDRGRFANISNRGGVGTGANIMIPGFVIEGPTNKSLVIRGAGPTLGELGVPGTISDPQLTLYYRVPTPPGGDPVPDEVKGANDNWEEAPDVDALKAAMAQVGAFGFSDGSADAALLATDLSPGAYTVQVSGVADVTGVGLAEIYDLGSSADGPTELVNISNRGFIGTGSEVQIPGFVIGGNRGRVVLVRAVGPTLGDFGVPDTIEDPLLELYDQSRVGEPPLFVNDNWGDTINATEVEATAARVGAFPLGAGSKDASILASLPPGSYTAVATGVDDATGVALVEVYVVTSNQRPTAFGNAFTVTSDIPNVLPLDELLGDDTDPENDVLSVGFFTQPDVGAITMNDDSELVYTSPVGFFGRTAFSYRASDGEYESVPATIALEVRIAGTVVWQGGSSDSFSDPANWVGGVAPGADDPVWIAPEGGGTVVVDADTEVGSIWAGDSDSAVTLELDGKNLTVVGGVKVQPGSTFDLKSGTLDTSQDAVIGGQFIWRSGAMAGEGTTVIAEGATAAINGAGTLLDGRDFINRGTLTQNAGSILSVTPDTTSTITNAAGAVWNAKHVVNSPTIARPNNAGSTMNFVNEGTLTKFYSENSFLGGTNGTFNLTSTGTIDVRGGALWLNGGTGEIGGTLNLATNAEFSTQQNGTSVTLPTGTQITGDGGLHLHGGTITLVDSYTLPSLLITIGTLNYEGALTVGVLEQQRGTISGPTELRLTETFSLGDGTHAGIGTTVIAEEATASFNGGGLRLSGGRNLTNHGTLTQTGGGKIIAVSTDATSTITNSAGAQWNADLAFNGMIASPWIAGATLNFVNEGTLTKGNSNSIFFGPYAGYARGTFNLTNKGVLEVNGGILNMRYTVPVLDAAGTVRLTTNGSTKPIICEGAMSLDGTLEVILAEGYTPASPATIRLIDFTSKTGAFSTVTPPQGRTLTETYVAAGLNVTFD